MKCILPTAISERQHDSNVTGQLLLICDFQLNTWSYKHVNNTPACLLTVKQYYAFPCVRFIIVYKMIDLLPITTRVLLLILLLLLYYYYFYYYFYYSASHSLNDQELNNTNETGHDLDLCHVLFHCTIDVRQSFCSESKYQFYRNILRMSSREFQRLQDSSPNNSYLPFVLLHKSVTPVTCISIRICVTLFTSQWHL